MFTRQQYMDGLATHEQYYGQFVTQQIIDSIVENFGIDALITAFAKDTSFNTIPLRRWDAISVGMKSWARRSSEGFLPVQVQRAGDQWSLSSGVCIAKEAARQAVYTEHVRRQDATV